ncbi:hypothetical protein KKC97_12885 [bacterium]|nr:hypothetical protein [bacterium]
MSWLASLLYPTLQNLQRHTSRRDFLLEERLQKKLRSENLAFLQSYSFSRAVEYANRMAQLSPGFRRHLEAAGVPLPIPEDHDVWSRIPMMTKTQIKDNPEAWYTVPVDAPALHWTSTSGSTGQPFRCPIDQSSMTAEIIANELNLKAVGWRPHFKEAVFKVRGNPPQGMRRVFRTMMGNIPLMYASRQMFPASVPGVIEELRNAKVELLRGYPTTLVMFAIEMLKLKIPCHIPIIVTIGEQLTAAGAVTIEKAFQGKVYRDYGASEAQHIAFECRKQDGYHIDLTRYYLELMNGDTPVKPGETGEIVITAFRNGAMPLVRYCIGDLATMHDDNDSCPCGSPLPRLGEVLGRVVRVTLTPEGKQISEFFFHSFVLVLNNAHEHIARYKVLQKDREIYEVLWVPRHERAKEHLTEIELQILEKANVPMKISWKEVEDIPPDPSGKRGSFVPLAYDSGEGYIKKPKDDNRPQ